MWEQLLARKDVVFCLIWFFVTAGPTTTLPADRSALQNAFHAWSPPETAGDPTNYISQTYNFAGYNAFCARDASNMTGPTPAPESGPS